MLKKEKTKSLATMKIGGKIYSIRTTVHAEQRIEERQVDIYTITGNILALGKERLKELQDLQEEAIIIDKEKQVSIVIGFVKNTIKVITVIGTENIWNNRGTHIINI